MPGTVVLHTVPLSPTEHRTVIDYRNKARLGRLWRELNARLLELADRHPGTYVLDFEAVVVDGSAPVRDERLYRFACMAWTSLTELSFAREAVAFCRALVGRSRKVLALDLDGTLWGGVVGDDGPAGIALGPFYPGNCYTEVSAGRRRCSVKACCWWAAPRTSRPWSTSCSPCTRRWCCAGRIS